MKIIAHTMEYTSLERFISTLSLRNYRAADYMEYKEIYEDCFAPMRQALQLCPVNCCDNQEELLKKSDSIFVLEEVGGIIGSVAIYGNEIEDLFVARKVQRKGYGQGLLRFAVARMQREGIAPIILHVADWNQTAVQLYEKNGFSIVKTEIVNN